MPNPNYNTITATTLNRWVNDGKFADAISGHYPLWNLMRRKKRIKTLGGGLGYRALENVMHGASGNPPIVNVTNPFHEPTYMPASGLTSAEYGWNEKQLYFGIPEIEINMQGSETRIANRVQQQLEQMMIYFLNELYNDLWAEEGATGANGAPTPGSAYAPTLGSIRCYLNGGGTNTSADDSETLPQQIATAVGAGALTRVGNIERNAAGNAYWCTPLLRPAAPDALTFENVSNSYTLTIRGNESADIGFMNFRNWNRLCSIAQGLIQFIGESQLANIGFQSIRFMGAEVVGEYKVPASPLDSGAGQIFWINTNYLTWQCITMKPQWETMPNDNISLQKYGMRFVSQLTSGQLGRAHARHARIGVSG